MADKTKQTSAPSGLSIARENNKLTFSWKIPSGGYDDGQQLQWRRKINGWENWRNIGDSANIGTAVTSKQVSISPSHFYPDTTNQLHAVQFRVRGNKKDAKNTSFTWSDWAEKSIDILPPGKPSLSVELTASNVCKFTWDAKADNKSVKWFTDVQWQSMLVKNCSETDGSKLNWKSSALKWQTGTGAAQDNKPITEDTMLTETDSYTRWFRVRARGPEGNSEWNYKKHVYAMSKKADVGDVNAKTDASGGIRVEVEWTADSSTAKPIDQTTAQYKIAVPDANMACPAGGSWTNADVSKDTGGKDKAKFIVDDNLSEDQCLWVRVNTEHDGVPTPGVPTLAKIGYLKNPTNVSVSTNAQTFRATITATNASSVVDSFLVVTMRQSQTPGEDLVIGIIPHGSSSVTVQCPDWTADPVIAFGVYAAVGSYDQKIREDGVTSYAVTAKMRSRDIVWEGGAVPVAPNDISVSTTDTAGTIRVTWDWSWEDADLAELSWADHADAWESTDAPDTFNVSNLYASAWNISGLETGKTWYVRVRLMKDDTYGPYSEIHEIDLASGPSKPMLALSQAIIHTDDIFTASWLYTSTDTTAQAYAEICEVTVEDGEYVYGSQPIAKTETARHMDIPCPEEWTSGETYLLALRVSSASGKDSDWSDPVEIMVAEPVTAEITSSPFSTITVATEDEEGPTTRTVLALTSLPMSIGIAGAGTSGKATVIVERAADYQVTRPDETDFTGFEDETIVLQNRMGDGTITVTKDELLGTLDDGAPYRLWAVVQDELGQVAAADPVEFEVHWSHQALMPKANEFLHNSVIEITPTAPTGAAQGDYCDIYRLSADRPVLIVENAEFGQTYVDPYPAIGDDGGHRIVYRTANGDYITADNTMAWLDLADEFDSECSIIDFAGEQLMLHYNLSFSNKWEKEFTETKYLGGAIQGDWAPAVSRNLSLSGVLITADDDEEIAALRRLAVYPGVCHVRTQDGSSFCANVQVSESRSHKSAGRKVDFSMDITRVDPEGLDGLTLEVWEGR